MYDLNIKCKFKSCDQEEASILAGCCRTVGVEGSFQGCKIAVIASTEKQWGMLGGGGRPRERLHGVVELDRSWLERPLSD